MKQLNFLVVVLLALIITSCNKSDEKANGEGDALIIAKHSGTNTVYGITLYAYTFSSFQSVTAVNSNETGKTYILKSNQGYKTNFYYETPEADSPLPNHQPHRLIFRQFSKTGPRTNFRIFYTIRF